MAFRRRGGVQLDLHRDARQGSGRSGSLEPVRLQQRVVREHAVRGTVGDDPPVVHDDDAREDLGDQAHVVRGHEHRLGERQEQADELAPAAGVQAGRRLVEDEDGRVHREDRRDRDPLPLAEREVVGDAGARSAAIPTAASARSTRAWTSSAGIPMWSGPKATSSKTVGLNSWSSGSWKTIPTSARTRRTVSLSTAIPATRTEPCVGRIDPVEVEHQRALARAVRPHERDLLARRRSRSTPLSASNPSGYA